MQARYEGNTNTGTFLKSDGKCTEMAVTRAIFIIIGQTKVHNPPPATPQGTWTATISIPKVFDVGKAACM
jgi:hypothetical protein